MTCILPKDWDVPPLQDYKELSKIVKTATDASELKKISCKLLKDNSILVNKLKKADLTQKHLLFVVNHLTRSCQYKTMRTDNSSVCRLFTNHVINVLESVLNVERQLDALCKHGFNDGRERELIDKVFRSVSSITPSVRQKKNYIQAILEEFLDDEMKNNNLYRNTNAYRSQREENNISSDSETEVTEYVNTSDIVNYRIENSTRDRRNDYIYESAKRTSTVNRKDNKRKRNEVPEEGAKSRKLSVSSSTKSPRRNKRSLSSTRIDNESEKMNSFSESEISDRKRGRRRANSMSAQSEVSDHKRSRRRASSVAPPSELNDQKRDRRRANSEAPEMNYRKREWRKANSEAPESEINHRRGRSRANSEAAQSDMTDNNLSYKPKPKGRPKKVVPSLRTVNNEELTNGEVSAYASQESDYDTPKPDDKEDQRDFNRVSKCIVVLQNILDDPEADNYPDVARFKEIVSSKESEEYEVVDDVDESGSDNDDMGNKSDQGDNENIMDNISSDASVKSDKSEDEANSDDIFEDVTKQEMGLTPVRSNDGEEEKDSQSKDEDADTKYGKKGPRTPPSPAPSFDLYRRGPRTPPESWPEYEGRPL